MACGRCRAHKIKCDRSRPTCKNCAERASQCNYNGERNKRRKLGDAGDESRPFSAPTSYRFVDSFVSSRRRHRNPSSSLHETFQALDSRDEHNLNDQETQAIASTQDSADDVATQDQPPMNGTQGTAGSIEHTCDQNLHLTQGVVEEDDPTDTLLDKILSGHNSDCLKDCNAAVWMRVGDGDEYTGPSSGISTISDLGLKWIQNNLQSPAILCDSVQDIRNSILSHLRKPKCIPPGPWPSPETHTIMKPLPSPEIARKYVDTYFSEVQTIFPVLDRAIFEAQLSANGSGLESSGDSCKALFYAVLASGCRAALSDETAEAFQESGRQSWGYFRNALCYEAKMVHGATDLTAVQALAVMTVFAQGMSSPQRLEYTVSSTASRLAQSLALHRYPPAEWNLTEAEKGERNRLFWVVYCLDKTIALRCGRPSIIQDDEISCIFPRGVRVLQNENNGRGGTTRTKGLRHTISFCVTPNSQDYVAGLRSIYIQPLPYPARLPSLPWQQTECWQILRSGGKVFHVMRDPASRAVAFKLSLVSRGRSSWYCISPTTMHCALSIGGSLQCFFMTTRTTSLLKGRSSDKHPQHILKLRDRWPCLRNTSMWKATLQAGMY